MDKTVVLGVTGGIAAYKTPELITRLRKHHLDTRVIMTRSATNIVNPALLVKASDHPVHTELFPKTFHYRDILRARAVEHIALAQTAALIVVVPATANIIAKIAHGIADDYLTTTVLAASCPIMICPAMNTLMWTNPMTKQNIEKLRSMGMIIVDPDSGPLACGYTGWGRLADIDRIEEEIMNVLQAGSALKGKHILITSGSTLEKIDDVRFITNKSSGKMGAAISESCFLRGANITLLRSKTAVNPRYKVTEKIFETAEELETLMQKEVTSADICFHVAAVSDYSVMQPLRGKTSSSRPLPLELTPKAKILDKIKKHNSGVFLVAFKAEWNVSETKLQEIAKKRLAKAHADMIVANDIGKKHRGFQSDTNEVYILTPDKDTIYIPLASKRIIADRLVDLVTATVSESE